MVTRTVGRNIPAVLFTSKGRPGRAASASGSAVTIRGRLLLMAQHQMSRGRRAAVYLGLVRDPDRSLDLGDHVLNLLIAVAGVVCLGLASIVIDPRRHPAYAVLVVI